MYVFLIKENIMSMYESEIIVNIHNKKKQKKNSEWSLNLVLFLSWYYLMKAILSTYLSFFVRLVISSYIIPNLN